MRIIALIMLVLIMVGCRKNADVAGSGGDESKIKWSSFAFDGASVEVPYIDKEPALRQEADEKSSLAGDTEETPYVYTAHNYSYSLGEVKYQLTAYLFENSADNQEAALQEEVIKNLLQEKKPGKITSHGEEKYQGHAGSSFTFANDNVSEPTTTLWRYIQIGKRGYLLKMIFPDKLRSVDFASTQSHFISSFKSS
jgi:hypothetical protein